MNLRINNCIEPRNLSDQISSDKKQAGFIYFDSKEPWPDNEERRNERLPDDWQLRNGKLIVKQSRKKYLPKPLYIDSSGIVSYEGLKCHFFSSPFRFCPSCGVSYGFREFSDFAKLSTLSSEGTKHMQLTVLTLSAILSLRDEVSIEKFRKEKY